MEMTEEKKKAVPKKRVAKKGGSVQVKAKKKTATARAIIRKGSGIYRINKMNVKVMDPRHIRDYIQEPIQLAEKAGQEVDVDVDVEGGGFMGQAVAARSAIAKALVHYTDDEKLRVRMVAYDRLLLVDDPRRKEPKKPLGRGARKARQLSFR